MVTYEFEATGTTSEILCDMCLNVFECPFADTNGEDSDKACNAYRLLKALRGDARE